MKPASPLVLVLVLAFACLLISVIPVILEKFGAVDSVLPYMRPAEATVLGVRYGAATVLVGLAVAGLAWWVVLKFRLLSRQDLIALGVVSFLGVLAYAFLVGFSVTVAPRIIMVDCRESDLNPPGARGWDARCHCSTIAAMEAEGWFPSQGANCVPP